MKVISEPHIFIDLETTGTDCDKHFVIEIGAVVMKDKVEVDAFSELAYPGEAALRSADQKAMSVNGITLEELRRARSIEEVAKSFHEFLAKHMGTLHAFPNSFERGFLSKSPWTNQRRWGECVQILAQEVMANAGALPMMGENFKRPKLSEAAAFFKVPSTGRAHRSLSDARTTGIIYFEAVACRAVDDQVKETIEDGA